MAQVARLKPSVDLVRALSMGEGLWRGLTLGSFTEPLKRTHGPEACGAEASKLEHDQTPTSKPAKDLDLQSTQNTCLATQNTGYMVKYFESFGDPGIPVSVIEALRHLDLAWDPSRNP